MDLYQYKKWISLFHKDFCHILSMPFIYMMIVPVVFMDVVLSVYHAVCFRLYGIPLVKREDYIVYDRELLNYLTPMQKFNCYYCSYVNGFLSYAREIAGRTEKYWCPIKHLKTKATHDWQKCFAEYGDEASFKKTFNSNDEFKE